MSKFRNGAIILAISLISCVSATVAQVFQIVTTPDPHSRFPGNNDLFAISASSTDDIWAVGQTAIHSNGTTWTGFSAPDMAGLGTSALTGVADLAPDNVWAVGYINQYVEGHLPSAIVEHFNGTNWSIFSSPKFAETDTSYLWSVAAISSTDIWAGGELFEDPYDLPLLEHFNGKKWTQSSPPITDCIVQGISADAANDVWAIGVTLGGGTCTLHYNGTAWQYVSSPVACCGYNSLQGVVALAPDNVWASGWYAPQVDQTSPRLTLIEHWNGTSWAIVSSPNVGSITQVSNSLYGITAVSANDVWAFGTSDVYSTETQSTLVLRWDGNEWSVYPSPDLEFKGTLNDVLWGGTVIGGNEIWIAGSNDVFGTLVIEATE